MADTSISSNISNSDFLKILNSPQHQLSPVALTLKNYFQYLMRPEEPVTADAFQNFLDHAISFPHWQQNRRELEDDCQNLIESMVQAELLTKDFLESLTWPTEQQVIEIENGKTALDIINSYWLNGMKIDKSKFKVFDLGESRFALVVLHPDSRLSVHQYDGKFVVRNGHLEPLRRDLALHYNAELELDPTRPQKLEVSPFIVARFIAEGRESYGHVVRGYVFQHLQGLQGQSLDSQPRIFFALKRLEKLFIRRESDPFYNGLIEDLERLLHWMRLGEAVNAVQVHEAYLKAQTALEEVFHGDKMLTLLLRDLEHQSAAISHRTGSPDAERLTLKPANPTSSFAPENDPWTLSPTPSHRATAMTNTTTTAPAHRPTVRPLASTKSSPTQDWSLGGPRTASLKKAPSPSTAKRSMNWELGSTPRKTKSSWEGSL